MSIVEGPVWRRWAVLRLLLIALAAELGFAVLNVSVMPVYLQEDRNFRGALIGAVLVAFLFSEAVFKPFAGHLADIYGRRTFLILAPCLVAVTPVLSLMVPEGWGNLEPLAFIGLRVIDGIAAAMLWPAAYAAVGEAVKPEERPQAMSLLNVCFMVGLAFGPWVGGEINVYFESRIPSFVLASCLFALCAVIATLFATKDSRKVRLKQGEELHDHNLRDLIECSKRIPFALALSFIVFVGVGFPLAIIKLFAAAEFGLSESEFGRLLLPGALAMAISGIAVGKLSQRLGARKAVQFGLVMCSAGLWVVASGAWISGTHSLIALAAAGAVVGVGFLLAIPAWQAAISTIDPKKTGSYLGAIMTAQGIGAIVGTSIGAALYDVWRYLPIVACAATVSIGALLAPFAVPTTETTTEPTETKE